MPKKPMILIGGGGHSRVLAELIGLSEEYTIVGIVDPLLTAGSMIWDLEVLGGDDKLLSLYNQSINMACIGVGTIKDNSKRKQLYHKVKQIGFSVPFLAHPKAILSKSANLSEGVQVMAGAIIQTKSIIGDNTIVNTGAIVDHDCTVGKHVHLCSGVVVSGGCVIDDSAFVGAGATIIQCVRIGKNSVVAAGAVVIEDVPDDTRVFGIPARSCLSSEEEISHGN